MTDEFDWNTFLKDWQAEVLPLLEQLQPDFCGTRDVEALEKDRLCFTGASDEQIKQLEQRIGVKLPPSYVSFLKASNGWLQIGMDAESGKLWSTKEVQWFIDQDSEWVEAWEEDMFPIADSEYFVYGEEQDPCSMRNEYLRTALAISESIDAAVYLLNPNVISTEGEWEAWFFANALPGVNRYRSFREMMEAERLRITNALKCIVGMERQ